MQSSHWTTQRATLIPWQTRGSFVMFAWALLLMMEMLPECHGAGGAPLGYGITHPMYVPGTKITDDMLPTPNAAYGIASIFAACTADANAPRWPGCRTEKKLDESFCKNVPEGISRTPVLGHSAFSIVGRFSARAKISCGALDGYALYDQYKDEIAPDGTVIVYTTNGTLPDIYGPNYTAPVSIDFKGGQEAFIVARCIEPGALPSRIAYAQRRYEESSFCGEVGMTDPDLWRIETDHKPLILPGCNPRALGKDACDGQTVVEQFQRPTPPATNIASPAVPTSPHHQTPGTADDARDSASSRLVLGANLYFVALATRLICIFL